MLKNCQSESEYVEKRIWIYFYDGRSLCNFVVFTLAHGRFEWIVQIIVTGHVQGVLWKTVFFQRTAVWKSKDHFKKQLADILIKYWNKNYCTWTSAFDQKRPVEQLLYWIKIRIRMSFCCCTRRTICICIPANQNNITVLLSRQHYYYYFK